MSERSLAPGIPITPENAPSGTRVKFIEAPDVDCYPSGTVLKVSRWLSPSSVDTGEVCPCGTTSKWSPARFVLADDLFPTVTAVLSGYKKEGKPDYSYLCRDMLDDLASGMEKGGTKHGRLNYLTNPAVTDTEILAAARRHALEDPEKIDDGPGGTGLPHRALAMANFAMLAHRAAARKRGEIK